MIKTLEIFGLPMGYMKGEGHFPDWGKKDKDDKLAIAKKRALASKMKQKKPNPALTKLKQAKGIIDKDAEEQRKPTHFDLGPFITALKKFITCNGESRSKFRIAMKEDTEIIHQIFVDEYGEPSFKKCVDALTLGKIL
jgi:hypothetical protein